MKKRKIWYGRKGKEDKVVWKKNIGDDGWSPTMENESAYDNEGGYISENGNWKIYRDGRYYEREDGYENFKRDGDWLVYGMNEYGRVEKFYGRIETLSEAKRYVEAWVESKPEDFESGGSLPKEEPIRDVKMYYYGGEIEKRIIGGLGEEPEVSEECIDTSNPYDVQGQVEADENASQFCPITNSYKKQTWYLTAEYPEVAKVLRDVAPDLWIYYKYMQRISISFKDMIRFTTQTQNYFNASHTETYRFALSRQTGTRGVYRRTDLISENEEKYYEDAYTKGQEVQRDGQFPIPVELVDVADRFNEIKKKKEYVDFTEYG